MTKIYTKKSYKHAAEHRYTIKIVHMQEVGLLHMTSRQAIDK